MHTWVYVLWYMCICVVYLHMGASTSLSVLTCVAWDRGSPFRQSLLFSLEARKRQQSSSLRPPALAAQVLSSNHPASTSSILAHWTFHQPLGFTNQSFKALWRTLYEPLPLNLRRRQVLPWSHTMLLRDCSYRWGNILDVLSRPRVVVKGLFVSWTK